MGIKRHKALLDRAQKIVDELRAQGHDVDDFQMTVSMETFKGYRIAIDAMPILFKKLSIVHRNIINKAVDLTAEIDRDNYFKQWVQMLIREVISFLEQGIVPVFVFDGKGKSELKKIKWDKNNKVYEKTDQCISDLKEQLSQCEPLSNEAAELEDTLRRKMGGRFKVDEHEPDCMLDIISSLGIPYVIADSEAEQMCAWLCLNGICEATYSVDSDTLPFGSPVWIKEIKNRQATIILLEPLLKALGLSFNSYVEMCIASGCDFNNNIDGFGIINVYKCIKDCEWIENLPDRYDITPLNHVQCRQIFAIKQDDEFQDKLGTIEFRIVSAEDMRDILMGYGLAGQVSKLKPLIDTIATTEIIQSEIRDPREFVLDVDS